MAHLFQVGAGSGGMVVLDLLARDERVQRVTLVEPDIYKPHNAHRHYFPPADAGRTKAELAARWLRDFRPDLEVRVLPFDLTDRGRQKEFEHAAQTADLGVCAVDNEPAKYHFDALMRRFNKPWTLGEVLSGGIGGWVHRFTPGGPCYGCVASLLQRSVQTDNSPPPDYANPGGAVQETTVPASKASIGQIASLHALLTLGLLDGPDADPGFTSLLWTLRRVPDLFDEAYRPYKFRVARDPACLVCRPAEGAPTSAEDLDVALDQALARLGDA